MIYENPLAEISFFEEVVSSSGDWESDIDADGQEQASNEKNICIPDRLVFHFALCV